MNELQIFKNEMFEVATKLEDETILFDAETVARSLGITDKKNKVDYVRWNRVNSYLSQQGGNSPQVAKGSFIPEPMVYKLAFKASNETAEKFQDWLAIEVIPSIRKHGGYLTNQKIEEALLNPDTLIQLATTLKEERTKRLVAEQQVLELKPKADYLDDILKNKGLVTITQIAKDYGMSGQKLNDILRDLKIQYKQSEQWLLYSKHQANGYTHSETIPITHSDGRPDIKMTTKWTQKGRLFLYETLKSIGMSGGR